ncbi:MAG TPA: glycosyltransferase family 2 protein [Patescibacteria group bacterium]|nr:glycosyltransferase family 2 protein [Patescibacteria group bacterium]
MIQKHFRISVVIPAYDEEDRIFYCLDALSRQTVRPLEIILVNNNSKDQTTAIAKRFKSVRIINEPRQGRAIAQATGFKNAKGDILARIDTDTIVPSNWIEQIGQAFNDDSTIDAISGYGVTRTGVTINFISDIWSWAYFTHCKAFFGSEILWGSNMAIKKTAWVKIKNLCSVNTNLHEDQDISLALASVGGKAKILPDLKVSVDFGEIAYLGKYWRYNKMKHHTRQTHRIHYRSNLPTYHKIPKFMRAYYHLLATYTVGLFMIITAINSGVHILTSALKQSSVYFWYQKIKSEFNF